jgi:hypothetical protein
MTIDGGTMRRVLLEVVRDLAARGHLQQVNALSEASQRLNIRRDPESEEALLTLWYDLFRTGHLSWGLNLNNPEPPFCHLTEQGRRTLQHLSRDPANPEGYVAHLNKQGNLDAITKSYISEALTAYNSNCFKAAAVMVGAAAESLVLNVRNELGARLTLKGEKVPKDLLDWRIKKVLDALEREFTAKLKEMSQALAANVQAYWPAFTQQIRATRNEAGHPVSVDPVTPEAVHASLLIFPELAKLANDIIEWIRTHYT